MLVIWPELQVLRISTGGNWATYGATVSQVGDAFFAFTGSSLTQPGLTDVSQISFWVDLPAGGGPISFEFASLTAGPTAVPEPTNVALGVFGGLVLAVGRRLLIARRTA